MRFFHNKIIEIQDHGVAALVDTNPTSQRTHQSEFVWANGGRNTKTEDRKLATIGTVFTNVPTGRTGARRSLFSETTTGTDTTTVPTDRTDYPQGRENARNWRKSSPITAPFVPMGSLWP